MKFGSKIAQLLVENGTIQREEYEIYQYGLEQGAVLLFNVFSTLVVGFLMHAPVESAVFLAAYIPIRMFSGGYHSSTQMRCYWLSIAIIVAALFAVNLTLTAQASIYVAVGTILPGVIIWILSPVEDRNKPLDALERVVYRKRARSILIAELIIMTAFLLLKFYAITLSISMALTVLSVLLIIGRFKEKRFMTNQ